MALPTVTEAEVAAVIDLRSNTVATPFITTAEALVEEVNLEGKGLSQAILKQIIIWLAAHFAAHLEQRFASETTGDARSAYQYKVDLGLNDTMYGQQAMLLDITGTLKKLNSRGNKQGPIIEVIPDPPTGSPFDT